MPRVALVSSAEAREHDTDLPLITEALGSLGIDSDIIDWDTAAADWKRFDAAVVRSPWDYHRRYDEFLAWLDAVSGATRLFNDADIIRWNTDKAYLAELIDAGMPVIPTTYIGGAQALVDASDAGVLSGDVVVKPTVSAGSNNTERHRSSRVRAAAHVASLIDKGMTAMVQPYQDGIDTHGESGLLYFNGEFSHAFRKGAILATGDNVKNGLFVVEDIGERQASPAERELGDSVVAFVAHRFGGAPLYARVDMVPGADGSPVLMEVELAEPSLFLHTSDGAARRFAEAVASVVSSS